MAIATSGEALNWNGQMFVTCIGGTSLIEINQDETGFVPVNGSETPEGVIADGAAFQVDVGLCQLRFTGAGTVSYRGPNP